jgi:putative PIN family toxin of toxin-antitoxin system
VRVVIDTNTIISALLIKNSIPRQAFDKAGMIATILTSKQTIDELDNVLKRDKFNKYILPIERKLFIQTFKTQSTIIKTTNIINFCRDTDDNKFLELATDGYADYIISGDNDLLAMNPYNKIKIITAHKFVDM